MRKVRWGLGMAHRNAAAVGVCRRHLSDQTKFLSGFITAFCLSICSSAGPWLHCPALAGAMMGAC